MASLLCLIKYQKVLSHIHSFLVPSMSIEILLYARYCEASEAKSFLPQDTLLNGMQFKKYELKHKKKKNPGFGYLSPPHFFFLFMKTNFEKNHGSRADWKTNLLFFRNLSFKNVQTH